MEPLFPPGRRPPNPVTRAAFRRQVRLEIYLPMGLALVGVATLVGVAVAVAWGTASSWADVVIVLLGLPLAAVLVLLLAVLIGSMVVLTQAIRRIPEYTVELQDVTARLAEGVRQGSDAAARTVIVPSAVAEGVAEFGRVLRSIFRTG